MFPWPLFLLWEVSLFLSHNFAPALHSATLCFPFFIFGQNNLKKYLMLTTLIYEFTGRNNLCYSVSGNIISRNTMVHLETNTPYVIVFLYVRNCVCFSGKRLRVHLVFINDKRRREWDNLLRYISLNNICRIHPLHHTKL